MSHLTYRTPSPLLGFCARYHPALAKWLSPRHRSNDNVFILRTVVEKAKRANKPVFAAFIDISNAFPSVNHDILWSRLYAIGVRDPIFNWLRTLYSEMTFLVRKDGDSSDSFSSNIGILQGDTLSPTIYNIYEGDMIISECEDDSHLKESRAHRLEQADDLLPFAGSAASLQRKLNSLFKHANNRGALINPRKSAVLVFNCPPSLLVPIPFRIGLHIIPVKTSYCYLGFDISPDGHAGLLNEQYRSNATKATATAALALNMRSMIGYLRPSEAPVI